MALFPSSLQYAEWRLVHTPQVYCQRAERVLAALCWRPLVVTLNLSMAAASANLNCAVFQYENSNSFS